MAAVDRYDAAIGMFIQRYLRDNMHTGIRGKVVGVDYDGPTVDIQPMAFTELASGTRQAYPTIYDVPLQQPSGNGGKARLTMPVKVGDTVGLTFSERNEDDNTDSTTHQLFPGWAVSQIFTSGNRKSIDPDKVVLENDKVKFAMSPEGDYILETPKGVLKVMADGTFDFGNGAATVNVSTSGQVNIGNGNGGIILYPSGESKFNGGTITKDGNFITKNGVDLDAFYADYVQHRHGGVQTGGGQTGTKV